MCVVGLPKQLSVNPELTKLLIVDIVQSLILLALMGLNPWERRRAYLALLSSGVWFLLTK
jgi:hypothetical protein